MWFQKATYSFCTRHSQGGLISWCWDADWKGGPPIIWRIMSFQGPWQVSSADKSQQVLSQRRSIWPRTRRPSQLLDTYLLNGSVKRTAGGGGGAEVGWLTHWLSQYFALLLFSFEFIVLQIWDLLSSSNQCHVTEMEKKEQNKTVINLGARTLASPKWKTGRARKAMNTDRHRL